MTDLHNSLETVFWEKVATNPDDRVTLLTFQDWLQDKDDIRWEALRLITDRKIRVYMCSGGTGERPFVVWVYEGIHHEDLYIAKAHIPKSWFKYMRCEGKYSGHSTIRDYDTLTDAIKELLRSYTQMSPIERALVTKHYAKEDKK